MRADGRSPAAEVEPFGELLRRHRLAAVLTQERLAERAGISATGIAALEAGRRRAPRATTVALLLDALGLDGPDREALIAAATGAAVGEPPPATTLRPATAAPVHDRTRFAGNFAGVQRRYGFVGRHDELGRLGAAWERRVRVVIVAGEAGAGKTRLVGELAAAMPEDAVVLWGRCTQDRLGAYEPFVDPVRAIVESRRRDGIPVAGDLARLLPELAGDPTWADAASVAEPGVERRLLFEAVAMLLADLGPTLLVLEDVHWADSASLSLLTHLAGDPRLTDLTMLATVRSTDQDRVNVGALAELRRHASIERVALAGLGADELAALVEEVAGGAAAPELVRAVAAATEGNPFFVEELTEHLLDGGGTVGEGVTTVPIGLRETLGHRLVLLSDDAQALLRSGAALGRRFPAALAGRLVDLPAERVVAAVEDALLSGLVTEASATVVSFSHALVQSAVYETTSAQRRLLLHRQAAEALEAAAELPGADDAAVFDVARHWALVAEADPQAAGRAAHWARRAGDAAMVATDVDEAIARYELAERMATGTTHERTETLLSLGAALSAIGRVEEADGRFRAALGLADELGDVALYGRAAIGLAATVRYGHSDPERIAALDSAIDRLGPDEGVLRPTAAAMLKRQLGFDVSESAYQRRQQAARLVLDAVTGDHLDGELLLSLGAARDSIVVDDPVVLGALSRQIIDVASSPRNLLVLANGWYGAAWSALELADRAGWDTARTSFTAIADELGLPYELALAATMAATTALMEGRYDDAERHAQRAFDLSAGTDPNAGAVQLTNAVLTGIDRGEAPSMVGLMSSAREELALVPTFMAGFAVTAARGGAPDLATELLDEQAAIGFDRVRRDLEWLPVIGFYSDACAVLGDTRHAATLHDLLAAHPARAVRVGPLAAYWGPVDHHLGALCRVLGRLDEAELRLRRAVDLSDRLGAAPWRARSQIELADVVEHTQRDGSRHEATALRDQAAATAAAVGATGICPP